MLPAATKSSKIGETYGRPLVYPLLSAVPFTLVLSSVWFLAFVQHLFRWCCFLDLV